MERCVNFLHLNIQEMIFKILLLKNQLAKKSVIYVETTSCKVNLKLFNNDRRGQGWAILQNNFRPLVAIFIKKYIEGSPLLKNQQARNAETCVEAPLGSLHSIIVNHEPPRGKGGHNEAGSDIYIEKKIIIYKNSNVVILISYMQTSL